MTDFISACPSPTVGLSDPFAGEFTEETRQRDLDAVLTAIGSATAVLLGISEGGWTAATYAIQHPEHITHLILYGADGRGSGHKGGRSDRAIPARVVDTLLL